MTHRVIYKLAIYSPPHSPQLCVELNGEVIYKGHNCVEYAEKIARLLGITAEYEKPSDPDAAAAVERHLARQKEIEEDAIFGYLIRRRQQAKDV